MATTPLARSTPNVTDLRSQFDRQKYFASAATPVPKG
jgi:hypothetical protein